MASIVVIDSEETVRSVVTAILEKAGHSVRATGDFDNAVELLRGSSADLAITNVFLRGITGRDAMRALREQFPTLPVLMVSGLPDQEVIQEWTRERNFDVFPKPFTSDALVQKVREMIG